MKHHETNTKFVTGIRWLVAILTVCLFSTSQATYAQELTVTGKITDQNNSPIPGVNILAKDAGTGTVSDINGKYSIKVQPNETLVVSFIGYLSQEISVGGRLTIDILLQEDVRQISEIVVVGYGVQKKSDLTGSLVSVKSEDLGKSKLSNIAQVLQGRASGVFVTTNSGTPGATPSIMIRGVSTINNSGPIYVVDGLQVDDISFLSPSDIESMEILKDASACAIYGSRGSNGVILVSTKRGNEGQMQVSVDMTSGISKMWKKIDMLNASQWGMLKNEALTNGGADIITELEDYQSLGKGTDWLKEITRTGSNQSVNVGVSGGNKTSSYYLSVANNTEKGIVNKTDYTRTSLRLNTSTVLKNWLTVGQNLSLEQDARHKVNEADEWSAIIIEALAIDPVTTVRGDDGNYIGSEYVDMSNPVAKIARTHDQEKSTSIIGNAFVEIKPIKSLVFKSNLGINYIDNNTNVFSPAYHMENEMGQNKPSVSRGYSQTKSWTLYNTITYNKDFGDHSLTVMAGNEAMRDYRENFGTSVSDIISNNPINGYISNGNVKGAQSYGIMSELLMVSYFGRVNYSYNNKYLLTASLRYDGASNFGVKNRWGSFPSFSLGWNVHKESFLSDLTFINLLKIRGGYGVNGNNKISVYPYLSGTKTGYSYVFGNEIYDGAAFPTISNPKIHWESNAATNIGFDLGLMENSITMSFDYYIKNTTGMLVQKPIPAHVGVEELAWVNAGKMQNKGIDLQLGYKKQFGGLSFEAGFNFNINKNELVSLAGADEITAVPLRNGNPIILAREGHSAYQFQGYKTDGIFQTQDDVDNYVDSEGNLLQPNAAAGDIRYKRDPNNPDQLYYGVIGNALPDFTYGAMFKFGYKMIDFSFTLQGVYGNDIFNGTMVYTERPDATHNMDVEMLKRWTPENPTNDAHHPRLNSADANNNLFSDRFVENGSYLRVKDLQVGFNLSQKLASKLKIGALRFYVGATNLITFTKYSGFDPEIGYGVYGPLDYGVDRGYYPQARQFFTGLSLTF